MSPAAKKKLTIIEPRAQRSAAHLGDLFKFRSFYPFLLREITMKKWKDTFLGFWWLIIRPLVPTVMAIVTFTFIVPMESYGLPYAIFYLTGFMTWNMFQATVTFMPRTMLWMRGIMKKTYFPKLLVPLASVGPPLIEFLVTLTMFVLALGFFFALDGALYLRAGAGLLLFPLCLFMALMMAAAIGMVAGVMALFVRDIVFSIGYFAQLFLFLTPVLYPITFVPESYRWLIYLFNPMAQLVEVSRWALTGQGVIDMVWLPVSCGTIVVMFTGAAWFFLRLEPLLNDAL